MTSPITPASTDPSLSRVILSLGDSSFADQLLEFLGGQCPVDHLSLIQLHQQQVGFICSANGVGVSIDPKSQGHYLSHHYLNDPNQEYRDQLSPGQVLMQSLQLDDINNHSYQALWHRQFQLRYRNSLLFQADKGLYCLNLYRRSQAFSEAEGRYLQANAQLLATLAIKHSRLAGSLSKFQTRDTQLKELAHRISQQSNKLTEREQQVCARILLGLSSEGIALDLNIKAASVHTYRKRAYLKLAISSQNELFALCINSV